MAKGLGRLPKANKIAEGILRRVYSELCRAELQYIQWDSTSKKDPEHTIKASSQMEGYTVEIEVRIKPE